MENIDFTKYLNEVNYNKVIRALQRGDVPRIGSLLILTAHNPLGKQTTAEENKRRHERLLNYLYNDNFRFASVQDHFLVTSVCREEAIVLGDKFQQQFVLWGKKEKDGIDFELISRKAEREPFQTQAVRRVLFVKEQVFTSAQEGFYIPFFDDVMNDKMPRVHVYREMSFVAEELPATAKKLIEYVNNKQACLDRAGMAGGYYWLESANLNRAMNQIKEMTK